MPCLPAGGWTCPASPASSIRPTPEPGGEAAMGAVVQQPVRRHDPDAAVQHLVAEGLDIVDGGFDGQVQLAGGKGQADPPATAGRRRPGRPRREVRRRRHPARRRHPSGPRNRAGPPRSRSAGCRGRTGSGRRCSPCRTGRGAWCRPDRRRCRRSAAGCRGRSDRRAGRGVRGTPASGAGRRRRGIGWSARPAAPRSARELRAGPARTRPSTRPGTLFGIPAPPCRPCRCKLPETPIPRCGIL